MKRIAPLTLALLLLAACGAPGAEPTSTPTPAATPDSLCEADFAAGPEDGAYTYTDEKLGLSLSIPDELAPNVAIAEGMEFFDENGDSISLYYIPQQSEHGCSLMKSIVRVPRGDYFDPERFYNRSIASFGAVAASEDSLYVLVDAIGGAAVSDETWEAYKAVSDATDSSFFKENMSVTAQVALSEDGGATMTRAEAALWAAGLLTAGSDKGRVYELRYTDVEPGADAARAISYLDSYGMYYGHDVGLFRPNDPFTRADFAELLQRLQLARFQLTPYPTWYGDPVEAADLDESHWAYNALNRAYKDGWLTVENGQIRPDEPITHAEMAAALSALYAELGE